MLKIWDFLNNSDHYIDALSKDIIKIFTETANARNLVCDFVVSRETGKIKERKANTSFEIDIPENTLLYQLKEALYSQDLDTEDDEQAIDYELKINEFFVKIGRNITEKYHNEIEETIRRILLSDSEKKNIPLDEIVVESIEISDWSSIPEANKYLLRIGKTQLCEMDTPEIVEKIQNIQEEKGYKSAEEAFEQEKDNFVGVESITTIGKFLYELTIDFFVDYSIAQTPPRLNAENTS